MKKTEYTKDFKDQTVKYVLERGKSGSVVSKELGIGKNTVCKWVREYQEENQNSETRPRAGNKEKGRIRELEQEVRKLRKALEEDREDIEIYTITDCCSPCILFVQLSNMYCNPTVLGSKNAKNILANCNAIDYH